LAPSEDTAMRHEFGQQIIFHGIAVFAFGLLLGFPLFFGFFPNPRIGLIAHLEGVLNGIFLTVSGLVWARLMLSDGQQRLARTLGIVSVYLNVFQASWWAVLGRSQPTPLFPAERQQFAFEWVMFYVVNPSLSMGFLAYCGLLLFGLRRGMTAHGSQQPPVR
jgi:(hydroxyamino)benzene mutase